MPKLVCFKDPAGAMGRDIHRFNGLMTATEMLMEVFPGGIDADMCSIIVNTTKVEVGKSKILFKKLGEHDVVTFISEPKGLDPFTYILLGAIAASTIVVTALLPKPQVPGNQGSIKQSPNNTLQGQTNIARPYQAWPDIFGSPRPFPDLMGEAVEQYTDNKKTVSQSMVVGNGLYDIQLVKAGATPLINFEGSTQEIIPPEKQLITNVSGMEATTISTVDSGPYNLTLDPSFELATKFGKFGQITLTNYRVTAGLLNIDLSGTYDVSRTDREPGLYDVIELLDPELINSGWEELDNAGGIAAQVGSCTVSRDDDEAVSKLQYSFGVNEIDGQEILAPNQGEGGTSASTNSLVTDIEYIGTTFTFSTLQTTEWDDIKTGFDGAIGGYYVVVDYKYSKNVAPLTYFLTDTSGSGAITSMTLVTDVGGDYYNIVISDFNGLKEEGGSPPYGQDITVSNSTGVSIGPIDTPIECDELWLNIVFQSGLRWTDLFVVTTVKIDKPSGAEIPGTNEVFEFSIGANSQEKQVRTEKLPLSNGRGFYRTVTRRVDDSPNNPSNPDTAQFEAMNCIVNDSSTSFGNITLLKTSVIATINATSLRENQINLDATRKVITYDLSTETINYTPQASRYFGDALLHEFVIVFGRSPNNIDLNQLYEIQDRLIEIDPNLAYFDYTFDDLDIGLEQRMDTILNVARCFKYLDGDVYRFGRDEAQEFASNVITQRDIAPSSTRNYSWQYRASMPSDNDSIKLEYVDKDLNKKAYIYRRILDGSILNRPGANPSSIQLSGCYNEVQANNRADIEIRKLIYQRVTVSDTCLSQCSLIDKGQAVLYAEQFNFNTFDGEIMAINGNVAYTSNGIEWQDGITYFVEFKDSLNNIYSSPVVPVMGANGIIEKAFQVVNSGILTNAYLATGTEQLGSVYLIGAAGELEQSKWTLTEKTAARNGNVELTMVNYDERVYELDPT